MDLSPMNLHNIGISRANVEVWIHILTSRSMMRYLHDSKLTTIWISRSYLCCAESSIYTSDYKLLKKISNPHLSDRRRMKKKIESSKQATDNTRPKNCTPILLLDNFSTSEIFFGRSTSEIELLYSFYALLPKPAFSFLHIMQRRRAIVHDIVK